jgi:pyruvate kinase
MRKPGKLRERRQRRSTYPIEALSHQLMYVKNRLSLKTIVLSDDMGQVITAVGTPKQVTKLALQAPWLVATPETGMAESVSYLWNVFPAVRADQVAFRSVKVAWGNGSLIVSAVGDSKHLGAWIAQAAAGVARIVGERAARARAQ